MLFHVFREIIVAEVLLENSFGDNRLFSGNVFDQVFDSLNCGQFRLDFLELFHLTDEPIDGFSDLGLGLIYQISKRLSVSHLIPGQLNDLKPEKGLLELLLFNPHFLQR